MTTERRKYFRIQDTALVKYRVVQSDMLDYERRQVHLNHIRGENARVALLGLETRLQEVLEGLHSSDPATAYAFELVNKKINLLERVVALETPDAHDTEYHEHEPQQINLSGGGMAIEAGSGMAVGAYLAIDLVLLPDHEPMRIFGRVVDCRDHGYGSHTISIAFEEIREEDRENLVKHIMRRQSEDIRIARAAVG